MSMEDQEAVVYAKARPKKRQGRRHERQRNSADNRQYRYLKMKNILSQREIPTAKEREPYMSPGDYDIPKLMGNKSIVDSSIMTPPAFTFQK